MLAETCALNTLLCLWGRVYVCIAVPPTWRTDWWNIWEKMYLFFPEEKKQRGYYESALSSKWTPPLQVDIALQPWPISFIFMTLVVTPHCQTSCYLFFLPVTVRMGFFCLAFLPTLHHLLSSIQVNILQPEREAKTMSAPRSTNITS